MPFAVRTIYEPLFAEAIKVIPVCSNAPRPRRLTITQDKDGCRSVTNTREHGKRDGTRTRCHRGGWYPKPRTHRLGIGEDALPIRELHQCCVRGQVGGKSRLGRVWAFWICQRRITQVRSAGENGGGAICGSSLFEAAEGERPGHLYARKRCCDVVLAAAGRRPDLAEGVHQHSGPPMAKRFNRLLRMARRACVPGRRTRPPLRAGGVGMNSGPYMTVKNIVGKTGRNGFDVKGGRSPARYYED